MLMVKVAVIQFMSHSLGAKIRSLEPDCLDSGKPLLGTLGKFPKLVVLYFLHQ